MKKYIYTSNDMVAGRSDFIDFVSVFYDMHEGAKIFKLDSGAIVITPPCVGQSVESEKDLKELVFPPDEEEYTNVVLSYDRGADTLYLKVTEEQFKMMKWLFDSYCADIELYKIDDIDFKKISDFTS